jgi:6-pyruvoyltetrahydropterin/6-carboxytetrahydropterin synthase
MYTVSKRMEVAGSHHLKLDYESKCQNIHGHNWIITCHFASEELNHNGMVIDFTNVKKQIHGKLDHQNINALVEFNPTTEKFQGRDILVFLLDYLVAT